MRSKKALLSFIFSSISQVINIVLSLIVRRLFISVLGADLLGLNALYSSIISFLSISELGIGQSISMCLYKAIAHDDVETTKSFMKALKKIYFVIGTVILVLGVLISPVIFVFTDVEKPHLFLSLTFVIYVASTGLSYFFSYKKILFTAEQKNYIVAVGQLFYHLVLNVSQLLILIFLKDYYFFLVAIVICSLAENIVVSRICTIKHPEIFTKANNLDENQKKDLFSKVKGMMFYKISNYLIQSADNIIISIVVGTIFVAYYSNYHLISNLLFSVFSNIATSSIAGLGNILYSDKGNLKNAFSRLLLVQSIVFSVSTACFLSLSDSFITIVFGDNLTLGFLTVLLLSVSYNIKGYSYALESIRESAGLFEQDRYINLGIAILNIAISVGLAFVIGINGVIIGTIICYVLKEFVVVPRIVFKHILPNEGKWYFCKAVSHFVLTGILMASTYLLHKFVFTDVTIATWLIEALIYLSICIFVNFVVNFRKPEFYDLKQSFFRMFKR